MQRSQSRCKTHKQQPYQTIPQLRQFLFGFEVASDKCPGEDQEAHVHKANQLERCREDQEGGAGVFGTDVDELHKERDVEQNRFRVGQAQHQRAFHDHARGLCSTGLHTRFMRHDRPEHFSAQPQQIECAEISNNIKQNRCGLNQRSNARPRQKHQDGIANKHAGSSKIAL